MIPSNIDCKGYVELEGIAFVIKHLFRVIAQILIVVYDTPVSYFRTNE